MFNPDVHTYQAPARNLWSAGVQTNVQLIAGVTGKKIVIDTIVISIGTLASTVTFESGAAHTAVGPGFFMAVNTTQWITDLNIRLVEGANFEFSSTGVSTGCVYVEYHLESGNV